MNFKKQFTLIFSFLFCWVAFGQNHAPLSEGHITTAEDFIQNRLKTNQNYDPIKIQMFLDRILREKEYFLSNLYETTLIEEIELQMGRPSNSIDEAREELDEEKSDYAVAFNEYLIPKLEELSRLVNESQCDVRCDQLVDEFILVYSSFYSPERYRNFISLDANISEVFTHRSGYYFERHSNRLEANNLVSGTYQTEVSQCLDVEIGAEQFLTENQLVQLKDCGFDLSLLNPGNSHFWKPQAPQIDKSFEKYESLFPREDEKLTFRKVRFSGKGSPKITARFKRDGEKYNVKVKIGGREPHTENFSARVASRIGLYQDPTEYRESVTIHFKDDDDYNEFQHNMFRKYGDATENFISSVEDYRDGKKITVRYASLEVTPDDLYKLGAPDVFGWDHKNRREFRGIILWMGFLNINDMKNTNWRMQLRNTPSGLVPELSMQDVGFSLGKSFIFDDVLEAAEMEMQNLRNVNGFEPQFVLRDAQGQINVKWNDFLSYKSLFETTTFSDLKWMARQIAKLTLDDLAYALEVSGFSEVERELYLRKLASRRDGMLEVFELTDEYELFNLPAYDEYEVPGVVEAGRIIETSVDSLTPYASTPAIVYIGNFLNQYIEIGNLNAQVELAIGSALGGNIEYNIPLNIIENENFSVFLARPGIDIGFVREIKDSRLIEYDENGDQKFYAVDHYNIGFTTQSGVAGELSKYLPVELNARVSHFKIKFDHYRPFKTVKGALTAPAELVDILPRMKEYIMNMKRNEFLTYSYETGLDISLEVGRGQNYRVEVGQERVNSNPITFSRNKYGEFEIYQEKINQRENYVNLSLGVDIPLFYIPIIGVEYSFLNYQAESKLYAFPFESSQIDDAISQHNIQTDLNLIEDLIDGNYTNPLLESKVKYDITAQGSRFHRRAFLSFLLTGQLEEVYAKTNASYQGSEPEVFHRFQVADNNTIGIDNGFTAHALWTKDKSTVEVQFNDNEPDDFVIILNNYTFRRQLNGLGVRNFIASQNYLYSGSDREDFFITDILPPETEVNDYKKVMSHVRVFLYADKFLENLDRLMDRELNSIVESHMARGFNPVRELRGRRVYNYLRTIRTILRQETYSKRRFASLLAHVVKGLNTQDYGVQVLEELFGKKHMFVMGEIYGILPSFSYTQDGTSIARRRFAGRSWGEYRKRPPIWKYFRDFPLMIRPSILPYPGENNLFLPDLPTAETEGVI